MTIKFFKSLFIFFLVLVSNYSFSEKLKIRYCEKKEDLYRCAENCKEDSKLNLWVEFLSNKENKEILAKYYLPKNKFSYSQIYNNCSIFDNKNWNCELQSSQNITQMNDGVYIRYGSTTSISACAK
jgi:hypothetical protein